MIRLKVERYFIVYNFSLPLKQPYDGIKVNFIIIHFVK